MSQPGIFARLRGHRSDLSPSPAKIFESAEPITSLCTQGCVAGRTAFLFHEHSAKPVDGKFSKIFGGINSTFLLDSKGGLFEVKDGNLNSLNLPSPVVDVASGDEHALLVTDDGVVWARGSGSSGCLGTGDTDAKADFTPIEFFATRQAASHGAVVAVTAGAKFSGALTKKGALLLWGANDAGQLGQESSGDMYSFKRYPTAVPLFERESTFVTQVSCGEKHCVAIDSKGVFYYWGNGDWLEPRPLTLPAAYERGIKGLNSVAAGSKISFATTEDGRLFYMGKITAGEFSKSTEPKEAKAFNENVTLVSVRKEVCVAVTQT